MASKAEIIERAARRMYERPRLAQLPPWDSLPYREPWVMDRAYWIQLAAIAWDAFAESIPELGTVG